MTHTARTVLPTDLVALVSYDGRVYANEAMTLDRIGTNDSPHPLETAFEQWFSFATGRHTWISVKGPTLRGLVSARKRGSKLAWEIDCLINASEADNSVVMSLLDQVTAAAGKSGAFKIFVRVPASSLSLPCASRAGFTPYLHEQVYCREAATGSGYTAVAGLRRRTKADLYGVFQLYNSIVPHEVRRIEAMTYAEWMGTQESLGKTSQYVLERDDRIQGWLRIARDGDLARFDLLAEPAALDDLIEAALAKTTGAAVCALLPDYQESTRTRLAALGFEPGDEYAVLARKTVRPVKSPRPIPALAHTALG